MSSGRARRKRVQEWVQWVRQRAIHVATSPWRLFKFLCFSLGLVVLVTGVVASVSVHWFYRSMPDVERMTYPELKKRARSYVQRSLEDKRKLERWTPIREVSRDLIYSQVYSEDGHFFEHDGVQWEAMVSALAENVRKKEVVSGASTITQQVAKNLFLDQEKTLFRKIKEIILAKKIDKRFSKNEILEVYLNMAEYGPDIFGIRAASRSYFGKTPALINAAEGAYLALMLPSPRKNHYAIFLNHNLTRSKRQKMRRVLRDMLKQELISASQYRHYLDYPYSRAISRRPAGKK